MSFRVHIKIADRSWILEKLAAEIAARSNHVSYGVLPNDQADIQYYVNYSCRQERVSPVEISFFTHAELDERARQRFFDVAADVEHCVAMSKRYADELRSAGVKNISTITPGVDLEAFVPKLRIGVVGRTYHTGRKGEKIVSEVMDLPGIEWRFTGSGWPGESSSLANSEMPKFYNDLDYVLVPSLYEGGPMCVLEALACGIEVISSDVGWVNEYPHIAFQNGDAESLRKVLRQLLDKRLKLRETVINRTWDAWSEEHLSLFDRLAPKSRKISVGRQGENVAADPDLSALLITHGGEDKSSLGGPSVRVPRTATALAKLHIAPQMLGDLSDNFSDAPVAHVFNIWPPESCIKVMSRAKASGKKVVFSPIFLNLTHLDLYTHRVPGLFSSEIGESRKTALGLRAIAREVANQPKTEVREAFPGYHAKVRHCVSLADHVVTLSEHEDACLRAIGAHHDNIQLVRNAVDVDDFKDADPSLFAERYNVDRYILCVGRIEPRKNQLILAYAARKLNIPVVFIGHSGKSDYWELVKKVGGENAHFPGRLAPTDPLLKSAFVGAAAFCLPSWAEGAPLAALEAAAAGVPLVLSDQSSEREYFGHLAEYVNPADVSAICSALERAVAKKGSDPKRVTDQVNFVRENFAWDKCAEKTANVYRKVCNMLGDAPVANVTTVTDHKIYIDLTTTAHFSGNPTGIARVEECMLDALLSDYEGRVVPIAWNARSRLFVQLSHSAALTAAHIDNHDRLIRTGDAKVVPDSGLAAPGHLFVPGGAWIRNTEYVAALGNLKANSQVSLTLLVHDLIQLKLKHLYPEGVGAEFEHNVKLVSKYADNFLVYSETTKSDLLDFLVEKGEILKKINLFRLGDVTNHTDQYATAKGTDPEVGDVQRRFRNARFVLYVSSIDIRKNHSLLINTWRQCIENDGARNVPNLLFVGRDGWRGEEIVDAVNRDETLQNKVHLLPDVTDGELAWLYRNCMFTVYPSLYEGWGLPVAESLAHGKLCITSNSTSTKEIAPTLTELLDPHDLRAWIEKISFFTKNEEALLERNDEIKREFKSHSWNKSVQNIVRAVEALPPCKAELPQMFPNEGVAFTSRESDFRSDDMCVSGWARSEEPGRWQVGRVAKLVFSASGFDGETISIRILVDALAHGAWRPRKVRIGVNQSPVQVYKMMMRPSYVDLTVPIGPDGSQKQAKMELTFETVNPLTPASAGINDDKRDLGVRVSNLYVSQDAASLEKMGHVTDKLRLKPVRASGVQFADVLPIRIVTQSLRNFAAMLNPFAKRR